MSKESKVYRREAVLKQAALSALHFALESNNRQISPGFRKKLLGEIDVLNEAAAGDPLAQAEATAMLAEEEYFMLKVNAEYRIRTGDNPESVLGEVTRKLGRPLTEEERGDIYPASRPRRRPAK